MSKIRAWSLLLLRVLIDILAIVLAFIMAYCVHFLVPLTNFNNTLMFLGVYYKLLIIVVPMWLVAFNLTGLYRYNLEATAKLSMPDRPLRIISGVTLAILATYGITFIWPEYFLIRQTPRPLILYVWIFGLLLVGLFRLGISWLSRVLDRGRTTV